MQKEVQNEIEITVEGGYHPGRVLLAAGKPSRLTFIRREQSGCSRELVIPALQIRRVLPTDVPVTIELPALPEGEYRFACGMNMLRGSIEVQAGV